ncbi:MAG: endo-1,4-beta-xylanase [Pirellulales bacterium]|nr:endo-1,4-beta-xylanase [Pirellulales bacterium]
MGQMRFRIHDRHRIAPDGLSRIYVAGLEEIPWSTHVSWEGNELVVERSISDSGCVYIPWQVDGHGQNVLTTTTLMERQRPYQLEVELARGLIHRIRNRLFVWEWLGLETPQDLQAQLQAATQEFALAATSQLDPAESAAAANRAISQALGTACELVAKYAEQAISARQRQTPIATLMGVLLSPETPGVKIRRTLVESCNIIQLPMAWRSVESQEGKRAWKQTDEQLAWCQKAGIKVAAGPLLRMDDFGVPDWMVLWEGDFDNLMRLMVEHVTTVVSRYAGRVHLWHVASRVNTGKLLGLEEEQRLHLVAKALELVQQIDSRTPTVVSFDQPWAEYLAHQDDDLAPLHYADALVRADLGVSGFGLEINAGFHPGGSSHRPTFELGRMLDQWSVWGLPLMVHMSTASSNAADPHAKKNIAVDLAGGVEDASIDAQHQWAAEVMPLLLARSAVQVILWNQMSDSMPHEFPNAGLFDAKEQPKSTLELMRDLRKTCLV